MRDLAAHELQHARPILLSQPLDEDVLTLQRTAHRTPQRLFERSHQRDQQRVGDVDHVGLRLAAQPVHELRKLFLLQPVLALEHGQGQLTEESWRSLDAPARDGAQEPGGLPQPIEQPWGLAEQRDVLFQVDADASEEDPMLADVRLIGRQRGVRGHERDVVTARQQRRGKRVVAYAAAAIHTARAGRDVGDLQASRLPHDEGFTAQPVLPKGLGVGGSALGFGLVPFQLKTPMHDIAILHSAKDGR